MLENNFIDKDLYSFEVNRKIVLKKKLINLKKENSFIQKRLEENYFLFMEMMFYTKMGYMLKLPSMNNCKK